MPLHNNITLAGDLKKYVLEGDDMHAINKIYDRIEKRGIDFYGGLDANAKIGKETGLRHYTIKTEKRTKTCSVFFQAGNSTGVWKMIVYAYGKHPGENNKQYMLYTYLKGNKKKGYSF